MDQWEVANKHRLCKLCLIDNHPVRECPKKDERANWRCDVCTYSHSNLIGCCPPEHRKSLESDQQQRPFPVLYARRRHTYSTTCPVKLTHPVTGRVIIGLAIIDNQSTLTFMDPEALKALQLPKHLIQRDRLATSTIQGDSGPLPCQTIEGLRVYSLTSDARIDLPLTTVLNPLPDAIDDVPSPDDVAAFPGLGNYAKHFPPKNQAWPTILLIGRDCIVAQQQEQFCSAQNQHQIIVKTPLGWTVMGSPPEEKTAYYGRPKRCNQ